MAPHFDHFDHGAPTPRRWRNSACPSNTHTVRAQSFQANIDLVPFLTKRAKSNKSKSAKPLRPLPISARSFSNEIRYIDPPDHGSRRARDRPSDTRAGREAEIRHVRHRPHVRR